MGDMADWITDNNTMPWDGMYHQQHEENMSDATFTGQRGQRIKNIGHKNLWYHTKDAPLVVRFGNCGDSEYGPFAKFEVMGDASGEYYYKPGKDAPDTSFWPALQQQIKAAGNDWVSVHASFNGDYPALIIENEQGDPVFPGDVAQTVQQAAKAFDAEPVNQQAQQAMNQPIVSQQRSTVGQVVARGNLAEDIALLARCIAGAEEAIQGSTQHPEQFNSEDLRAFAVTLFIQAKKG